MLTTATVLAVWLGLWLPGLGVARLAFPERSTIERLGLGVALAVALAVIKAVLLHRGGLLAQPGWLAVIEGSLAALGLVAWMYGAWRDPSPRSIDGDGLAVAGLATATAVGGALRLALAGAEPRPLPAFDAPAHCTLARALLLRPGEAASWAPFMDAQPHYPWGVHALLAELAGLTGAPIHAVFTVLVTAGLGMATIVVLAGLARAVWRDDRAAVGTAMIYGVASGSLGLLYGRWGGLPSEVGLLLVVGIGLAGLLGRRGVVPLGLLTLGLLLAHHLSAAIGAVALGATFGLWWWVAPGARTLALRQIGAVAVAALAAAPMWRVVLAVDLGRDTSAFALPRHMDLLTLGAEGVGAYVLVFALVPFVSGRRPRPAPELAVLTSLTALVFGFVLCFSVAKLVTGLWGTPRAILVPSRWAVASTYPLAILAGGGAAQVWAKTRSSWLRWAALAALVSSALYGVWREGRAPLDPAVWAWHQRVTPRAQPGDVVVSLTAQARWASYLTGLESGSVPAPPGSDPLTPRAQALAQLPAHLLSDGPRPDLDLDGAVWVVADLRLQGIEPRDGMDIVEREGPLVLLRWRLDDD